MIGLSIQLCTDYPSFSRKSFIPHAFCQSGMLPIAAMPLSERHKILASSIAATAQDFLTDPELTEFAALDEDWELDRV
jgi:hypothetical protein